MSLVGRRFEDVLFCHLVDIIPLYLHFKTFINLFLRVENLNSGDSEGKFHYTDCHKCSFVVMIFFLSCFQNNDLFLHLQVVTN